MERLRSHSPALALAILTAISTIGFVDRIVVNALVEPIREEFGLSDAQIGLLGLAYSVLNVILGIFVARIAERKRRMSLIALGTLLWSIAAAACGLVRTWPQLLLGRVGVGIGEAVGLASNQSVLSDYFRPERRATAMSVLLLAPPLGAFIGLAGGGLIAQAWGWRMAFVVTALPGFVLAALAYLFVAEPERGQHDPFASKDVPPIRAVFRRFAELPSARHLVAGSVLASLVGFGLNAFFAALIMRRFGLPIGEAGLYAGLIASLPASLSIVGGGILADRLAGRVPASYALVPAVCLLLAAPLFALAITRDELVPLLALVGLSTLLQFSYLGMTFGTLQNMMHPRMRATANAFIGIVFGFAGGLGPLLVGTLSDRFSASGIAPGVALAWAMACAAIIYWWSSAHYFLAARSVGADLARVREGRI